MGLNKINRSRFARFARTAPQGEPNAGTGAGGGGTGGAPAPANPAGSAGATTPAGDEWTPPTRDEFEALQKRLTKVNGEAAKYRLRAKAAIGGDGGTNDGNPDPVNPTAPDASKAEIAQLKRIAINAQIRSDLTAAGFQNPTKDRIARALRMIDVTAIDLDEGGDVDGLDEQVEQLKVDFPEFFTEGNHEEQQPPRRRAPKVSAAGKAPDTTSDNDQIFARTKTSASRWADVALGKVEI